MIVWQFDLFSFHVLLDGLLYHALAFINACNAQFKEEFLFFLQFFFWAGKLLFPLFTSLVEAIEGHFIVFDVLIDESGFDEGLHLER